jgi:hypothetical protein
VLKVQKLDRRSRGIGPARLLERDSTGHYRIGRRRLTPVQAPRWIAAMHFDGTFAVDGDWDDCVGMNALLTGCADLIEKGLR